MKRLLSFLLVMVLVFGCCNIAFAAKPAFSQQPETQTASVGGSVVFSVKAKDYTGLTWYFVDPVTLEETSGRNLAKKFPGLRVTGPNKQSITLRKIPAEMNGYSVFCRLAGNGYKIDSDTVQLILEDAPSSVTPPAEPDETTEPAEEPEVTPEPVEEPEVTPEPEIEEDETPEPVEEPEVTPEPEKQPEVTPEPEATPEPTPEATPEPTPEPTPNTEGMLSVSEEFTVTANGVELYELDRKGKPTGEGHTSLTFSDVANVYVKADGNIEYLMINSLRLTPEGEFSGITIRGLTEDTVIDARVVKPVTEILDTPDSDATEEPVESKDTKPETGKSDELEPEAEPDEKPDEEPTEAPEEEPVVSDTLFHVSCENCRFTGGSYSFAEEGDVPMGTVITVAVGSGDVNEGYSINGGEPENIGKTHFKYTITGNTTISMTTRSDALVYGIEVEQFIEGTQDENNVPVNQEQLLGEWVLSSVDTSGISTDAASSGITLTLTLNNSGTAHLVWQSGNAIDENCTWAMNEGKVEVTYSEGVLQLEADGETLKLQVGPSVLILARPELTPVVNAEN